MEISVSPIHFEDKSGTEFERLVFAYAIREKDWDLIEWLGQTGKDGGRDIWAEVNGKTYCYLCANYQNLTLKKAKDDINKLVKHKTIPDFLIIACGGKVTSGIRTQIKDYSIGKGINQITVWTGVEFEEKLRKETPELIRRFVMGEKFPDSPTELIQYAKALDTTNDKDIVDLLVECFDRPAFTTPFYRESNIPDFEKALNHTIEVLNTGVHRLNDGTIIRTIPSRHRLSDSKLKTSLGTITQSVIKLRDNFMDLKKRKEIKPCECGGVDCSVYMLSHEACDAMDKARKEIFNQFKEIKPDFPLSLY